MRTQIFISYRRDGGLDTAKALCSALSEKYEVFFDMESLRNGRFDQAIDKAITECSDFLLILSPKVFDRFEEPEDWIYHELKLALDSEKNIIPIFLDGFSAPSGDNEIITKALRYNGVKYGGIDFTEKLFGLLTSDERCLIDIECRQEGYFVSKNGLEALKISYKRLLEKERYDTEVKLKLPNVAEAARTLMSPYSEQNNYAELVSFIENRLTYKYHRKKDILEAAFKLMINDKYNIVHDPIRMPNIPQYAREVFTVHGKAHDYYAVSVWEAVINELLTEITMNESNRANRNFNLHDDRTRIDCVIDHVSKSCPRGWYFQSKAKILDELPMHFYFFERPSLFKLDPKSFFDTVLPDFYYHAAMVIIFHSDTAYAAEFLNPESPIHLLANYWYGLS